MASCTSDIKLLNLDFYRKGFGVLQQYGTRSWTCRRPLQYTGLLMSQQRNRFLAMCSSPLLETQSVTKSEDGSEEIKSATLTSEPIPNFNEVKLLITELCETSTIAQVELKFGEFHLSAVRDLNSKIRPPPPPAHTSVSERIAKEVPGDLNGSISKSSLAISKPVSSSGSIQELLDKAADEGLVIIQSPRVGFFRRSRTIKGKRTPPSCKEKQMVKEGKVICYIEQLGGEVPIESDVTGEVIKILREDGEPVGYGDALIAVLPSFPGIKMLQ